MRPILELFTSLVYATAAIAPSALPDKTDNVRSAAGATKTCTWLQSTLGSAIVLSSGAEYSASITNTWNFFNTEYFPACIVLPRNITHVQIAMRAIYQDRVHYAVQAGSHSAMRGWNNVQDGVLILFSHMSDVRYDAVKDTITLQPGVHWGDAIATLEPYGVAPLGGRLADVGTGLLLGGGLSYLSPEYGFSADSFKELDIVLVNGELVTATATNEYADLFRALKGGANRFGIVTRYDVSPVRTGTRDDKNWYGGLIVYPDSSAEAIVNATASFVRRVKDSKAAILVSLIYSIDGGVVTAGHVVVVSYRGAGLPPAIFGEFLEIPATVKLLGPASYYDAGNWLGTGADRGHGQLFGASALGGDETQYLDAFRHWKNYTDVFRNDLNMSVLAFTPILDAQIDAGRARGGNSIDPPKGGYAAIQIQSQLPLGITEVRDEVERGRQLLLKQIPLSPDLPLYINECDAQQNVFKTYGDYERLKRTYAKYDPTRFNIRYTQGPMGL